MISKKKLVYINTYLISQLVRELYVCGDIIKKKRLKRGERINQLMSLKCGAFIARKFDLKSMVR